MGPWRTAWERALYGPDGFYRRTEGPVAHFATSVTRGGGAFAAAVLRLLTEVDALLGHPDRLDLVDVGAGHGELLVAVAGLADPALNTRLALQAVELAPRPARLPTRIAWSHELPEAVTGLVLANEWLDNVPLDVAELTANGPRVVLVDPATGVEELGGPLPAVDAAWLREQWPLANAGVGDRAEIGSPRDAAWAALVGRLRAGVALAADYSHDAETRAGGQLSAGTLQGYCAGAAVPPVPDGSCDITATVALDACAVAGRRAEGCASWHAGAAETLLTRQRAALTALGVDAGRPAYELARRDPRAYVDGLQRAGQAGELLRPGGLGDVGWLVQTVGVPLPPSLAGVAASVAASRAASRASGARPHPLR